MRHTYRVRDIKKVNGQTGRFGMQRSRSIHGKKRRNGVGRASRGVHKDGRKGDMMEREREDRNPTQKKEALWKRKTLVPTTEGHRIFPEGVGRGDDVPG